MTKRTKEELKEYIAHLKESCNAELEKLKEIQRTEKDYLKAQYPLEIIYKKQRLINKLETELKNWKR